MFFYGENLIGGYDSNANILRGCTIGVNQNEIAVIVGANGAGKSTAMKALLGLLPLQKGNIIFENKNINNLLPQARVRAGLGFVPQTQNVFTSLTVQENLEMGAISSTANIKDTLAEIYSLFPFFYEKQKQAVGELSGGQRQQVAIGRALMMKPKVLMLDEPTAGVSPIIVDELFEKIIAIKQTGVGILMVEQNARQALQIADRGYVLVQGENAFTDSGKNLLANENVRQSFLGLSNV